MQRSSFLALAMWSASLALMAGFARPAQAQAVTVGAPQPPTDILAIGRNASVYLAWIAPLEQAVGYNIYRRNAGETADKAKKTNTALVTSASGIDTGLTNGNGYVYFVTAVYNDAS